MSEFTFTSYKTVVFESKCAACSIDNWFTITDSDHSDYMQQLKYVSHTKLLLTDIRKRYLVIFTLTLTVDIRSYQYLCSAVWPFFAIAQIGG